MSCVVPRTSTVLSTFASSIYFAENSTLITISVSNPSAISNGGILFAADAQAQMTER
jgi:hypothetical protein